MAPTQMEVDIHSVEAKPIRVMMTLAGTVYLTHESLAAYIYMCVNTTAGCYIFSIFTQNPKGIYTGLRLQGDVRCVSNGWVVLFSKGFKTLFLFLSRCPTAKPND